jgi:hypothetical protein
VELLGMGKKVPQKRWYIVRHASGFYSIVNHGWPEYANTILLDDFEECIYVPGGANSYDQVLYRKYSYWEVGYDVRKVDGSVA